MDEALKKEIDAHFEKYPEVKRFLNLYNGLCQAVDDLIDRDSAKISDYNAHALDCFNLAMDTFSSPFYTANSTWLYPLVKHLHRIWVDSIAWENNGTFWKNHYADVLRCCGNELTLALLEHVCRLPYAEIRRLSLAIREECWLRQHNEEGKPI